MRGNTRIARGMLRGMVAALVASFVVGDIGATGFFIIIGVLLGGHLAARHK